MADKADLKDTGERMIPETHGDSIMYAEHMTRYLAARKLAAGKVVLDIATGTGYGAKLLAEQASKVYAVDSSAEAIAYAKVHYQAENIEYSVGNAEQLSLPDASVDLVVSFETLEHIPGYNKFLAEIKRVMKPDGLAIISTPNDAEFAEGNHFHIHQFTEAELQTVLKKHFTHQKSYYQATWAYAQISDAELMRAKPPVAALDIHNFSPLDPHQYLYFYILCSNRSIRETIAPIGGLGGHYSARELGESRVRLEGDLQAQHEQQLAHERDEHRKTKIKLKAKEREIHAITTSSSYKLARLLAASKQLARKSYHGAKELNPKRVHMLAKNKRHVKLAYASPQFTDAFNQPASADLAVVIHLYYTEMLPFFVEKLKSLQGHDFDVYITVPEDKAAAKEAILRQLPNARVASTPNCGRDVLPFAQVIKQIEHLGYQKVLKLHSKKSPHRGDGEQWRDKIIDSLLPADPAVIETALKKLSDSRTALIGPAGEYVSLLVNFSATAHYMKMLSGKILGGKVADELIRTADEYGFFAGTMWWARFDALLPVIHNVNVDDFEPELGQEDSTLAHALERLLNVIPELQNRSLYDIQAEGVAKRDHHTTNIPDWSEVALED